MIPELKTTLAIRSDSQGDGNFGASRGSREHMGIDFAAMPGSQLHSPVDGHVTKLGYCYNDDLQWRYIEVTDVEGIKHRFFYITPCVPERSFVLEGDVIGTVQDISERYNDKMIPHIHYECKNVKGDYLHPGEVERGYALKEYKA